MGATNTGSRVEAKNLMTAKSKSKRGGTALRRMEDGNAGVWKSGNLKVKWNWIATVGHETHHAGKTKLF